jgi:hypothetical protein
MHKKTYNIIKNLGFGDEIIKSLKQNQKNVGINKKILNDLKKLGVPDAALKQIKSLEQKSSSDKSNLSNTELINLLAKRCKRSFDAFANKGGKAKILFLKNSWTIYGSEYSKEIERLHTVCKPYFDEWSQIGLQAMIYFDGTECWKILANKTDLTSNNEEENE